MSVSAFLEKIKMPLKTHAQSFLGFAEYSF